MTSEKTKNNVNRPKRHSKKRPNQRHSQSKNQPRQSSGNRHRKKSGNRNSKWNRHRISDHFSKRDFDSRKKDCGCNTSIRISLGLVGVIEALRAQLNQRIEIITGFYCAECRDRQYGIKRDFHHTGVAADIRVKDMSTTDLFLIAETYPEIKGLGINFDTEHVHIDTRKEDERQTWVEINNEFIELTPENRDQYIKTTVSNETPAADS